MIFWIVFAVVAFVLFFVLIYNVVLKKYPTKDKPKSLSEKPKEENTDKADKSEKTDDKGQTEKDEIPQILQDVTRGNYMYDLSDTETEGSLEESMTENPNISRSDIKIKSIELEGEMEDEPLTTKDILDQLDGEEDSGVTSEIKKMSPQLKAILIANLLNKKDNF